MEKRFLFSFQKVLIQNYGTQSSSEKKYTEKFKYAYMYVKHLVTVAS